MNPALQMNPDMNGTTAASALASPGPEHRRVENMHGQDESAAGLGGAMLPLTTRHQRIDSG